MDRLELLHQDEIWVDGQNRIHRIAEMNIRHAQNTYRYLTGYSTAKSYLDSLFSSYMSGPGPSGDAATDAYEGEMARLEEAMRNPVAWAKELPLTEALQERGWGCPAPEVEKPSHREILVLVKVKIGHDADANPVEYDIEEALKNLPYDIEVADFR